MDARAARRQACSWQRAHPIDLLYERAALFGSLGRLPGAARVVELNAPLAWEAVWFEGLSASPALLAAEARSLADADLVVVVSEPLVDYALRRGADPRAVLLLPNGADPPDPPGAPTLPRAGSTGGFVLGYAGTFKPWHGLADAIPALQALAPDRVELWGDGPERRRSVRAMDEAGLAADWRGWGSPTEIAAARAGWSAAWVPRAAWPPPGSRDAAAAFGEPVPAPYFSPLKEAEASAQGLPIWRGAGPVELSCGRPRSWSAVAAEVLRALDARGVPAPRGSWFNGPGSEGHTGAA